MGLSQSYRSQKTQVPVFHRGIPTKKCVSLWISGRSTHWLQMILLTIFTHSALCQMMHNTWQGSLYSPSLIAPKFITACRGRTNGQWKCSHSVEPLLHVSADLCLPFQFSCVSSWTQLSRLTNVLNKWMILELPPIMLRILHRTFGQSSSALAKQVWILKFISAILESGKLNL